LSQVTRPGGYDLDADVNLRFASAAGVWISGALAFAAVGCSLATSDGRPEGRDALAWSTESGLVVSYYVQCLDPDGDRRFVSVRIGFGEDVVWAAEAAAPSSGGVTEFLVGTVPDGFVELQREDELIEFVTDPAFRGTLGVVVQSSAGSEFSGSVSLREIAQSSAERVIWGGQLMDRHKVSCR
jgi:hypothetical protein